MKHYRITVTVNVFIDALDEDHAKDMADEMHYDFIDPRSDLPLETEMIETEITQVEK